MTTKELIRTAREVAPGVHWIGVCTESFIDDRIVHGYNSCYLVLGEEKTLLVDTSAPNGWEIIDAEITRLLDGRTLDYVLPTHPEIPHAGNLVELVKRWPEVRITGDLRNWHLYLPGEQHRFRPVKEGEFIELGGRAILIAPAIVHDLRNTLWAFDTLSRTLFVSDGYSYSHEHDPAECGLLAEEMNPPPAPEATRQVIERALNFTQYEDADITDRQLRQLLVDLDVLLVGPAHGGVVTEPATFTKVFVDGLRRAQNGGFDD